MSRPLRFPTPAPDLTALVMELAAKVGTLQTTVAELAARPRRVARLDSTGACLGCLHPVHPADRCNDADRFGRCECETNWQARFTVAPSRRRAR